jgi:flagellin
MRINNNLMAMNTHRQLGINTNNGAKSIEKLSSGYRINRAGDDAAGLAISEKMRAQIRGLNKASRNSQDGISLIQTAEGALNETQSILQRMRELAVQSANDTNVDTDRSAIQNEIKQLTEEIDRIADTTEFNTKKLLNGELDKIEAKAGMSKANDALKDTTVITDEQTAGAATGKDYGKNGGTAANASAANVKGTVKLNDLSAVKQGVNNELTLNVNGQEKNIVLNAESHSATSGISHSAGPKLDGGADTKLSITLDGHAQEITLTGTDYTGDASWRTNLASDITTKLNAKFGGSDFTTTISDEGQITITHANKEFSVGAAASASAYDELFNAAGSGVNSSDDIKGAENIKAALNAAFAKDNIEASASLDENKQLVITTSKNGSEGTVEVKGGGFASSFIEMKSENTTTIGAAPTAGDKFKIQLEGSDGTMKTVELTAVAEDSVNDKNTATEFEAGTNANTATAHLKSALEKAIAADASLKDRYEVSVNNNNLTIKATNSGDGHKIDTASVTQAAGGGSLTITSAGEASDAQSAEKTVGKDAGDVDIHGDKAANVVGSKTLTDKDLASTNIVVGSGNNELTYKLDGSPEQSIVLGDKTYNGTAKAKASKTVKIDDLANSETFKVQLQTKGGYAVEIALTGADTPSLATHVNTSGDNIADTKDLAKVLQEQIDANANLKGQYKVSVANGNEVTIEATEATDKLNVGRVYGTSDLTVSQERAGSKGANVESLVDDIQAKMDEKVYSTQSQTIDTNSNNDADKFIAKLEGADGNAVTITLTSDAGNTAISGATANTAAVAGTFDRTIGGGVTDSPTTNAFEIAKGLNAAIEGNDQLKGRYEAVNENGKITIKALNKGDGSSITTSFESNGTFEVNGGTTNATIGTSDVQETRSGKVSIENNKLVIRSDESGANSSASVTGANLADTLFGTSDTRTNNARSAANTELKFTVDGNEKTIQLEKQTYQDLDELIKVNAAKFDAAGVTATNRGGQLELTSKTKGQESEVTTFVDSDAAKQLGLVKADGSALESGFTKGTDGNLKLDFKLDGGDTVYTAELQKGTYTDKNVLASAVESAMNKALSDANAQGKVKVSAGDDGKLVFESETKGVKSSVDIVKNADADASYELGATSVEKTAGVDEANSSLNFQIGANSKQTVEIKVGDMRADALGVKDIDISSHDKAQSAIDTIDKALKTVSDERSKLGAYQNRLEYTIKNLDTSAENLQASESRIRDVDMAKEMMNFTKNNILKQAAQAMLAQANQAPQGVLQLLR